MTEQFAVDRNPEDLTVPLRGATFGEAVQRFFRLYFVADGRASRSEYWWAVLLVALVALVVGATAGAGSAVGDGAGAVVILVLAVILGLGLLVVCFGTIALTIRRLHDANQSGWWYLPLFIVNLIPVIGIVSVVGAVVIGLLKSDPAGARFDVQP
ncbi:DUF805 domain-containing protein [Tsukamurella paurometabola]|uniref:DUF805 domain-containing protein n=1 Tax=Tsukamurella paurometabola TaxID=2061 RepID=A0A3P8KF21_TSUPA|nr:DUF805 domain-containing protein [Tsukamurella paurometabola]MBS4101579.1 DUF805 domain-containing protein [Tsukamurella paurometabola]UEA81479.1 DUF805 domain-containing protein [Tsukamurella paurometabola]VDR38478.1 Inner membrane protein yhaH [Tsukamurella paurometabola]